MPSPPTLEIEPLLVPLDGPNPSGRSVAYEGVYDAIREARRADDTTNRGEWTREPKVADWSGVIALATDCLKTKSKDLQVAAWLTEALARLHGFAGLRDGFQVMHGIQQGFWETFYPEIDDGDIEPRFGPFLFLNDPRMIPFLVRTVPLTRGLDGASLHYDNYRESRETENLLKKNPEKSKAILAEGRIPAKVFDDQVKATPRAYYEGVFGDLLEALEAFQTFDTGTDARFGKHAPSLLNVGKALDEVKRVLEPIVAAKRLEEPDPEPELPPAPEVVEAPGEAVEGAGPAEGSESPAPAAVSGMDAGKVLIQFRQLAEKLAETGVKLEANRKRYEELRAEMKALDAEYEQLARAFVKNGESQQLLHRLLKQQGG